MGVHDRLAADDDLGEELDELLIQDDDHGTIFGKLSGLAWIILTDDDGNDDIFDAGVALGEYLSINATHVAVRVNLRSAEYWFVGPTQDEALAGVRLILAQET